LISHTEMQLASKSMPKDFLQVAREFFCILTKQRGYTLQTVHLKWSLTRPLA